MSHALAFMGGRRRPRALLAFSGFMPTVEGFTMDLDNLEGMPVAIGHGTYDPVIGVEWGRRARDRLESAHADVLYRESPMGHTIDPAFVQEVAVSIVARPSSQNRAS
jgi:phospholipase/carboxylesterase